MNSNRNLYSDNLQIILTTVISTISTVVNFFGFYIVCVKKSKESKSFKYTQLLYQVVLYLSQFYAGTLLNIVFLFPVPGIYCIGLLRNLSGKAALWSFILFDVLFSLQGQLLAVVMVIKVRAIARPGSPFKMSLLSQSIFITVFISCGQFSQLFVLLASYSPPSQILEFISISHPSMTFLSRYPFLWMLVKQRHFVALNSIICLALGTCVIVFSMSYVFLMFELDIQVNTMSRSTNKFHKRVIHDILFHGMISLPFFILIPAFIFVKFFIDEQVDLSIPTTISFSIFVSAPIPSMLILLFRNQTYRDFILKLLRITRQVVHSRKVTTSHVMQ